MLNKNAGNNLNNSQKLTVKQLRRYKGLSNLSDADAIKIIDGLYDLSILTYKIHLKNGT